MGLNYLRNNLSHEILKMITCCQQIAFLVIHLSNCPYMKLCGTLASVLVVKEYCPLKTILCF